MKEILPDRSGSRVMKNIFENEEFFGRNDRDKVTNTQKRFHTLESNSHTNTRRNQLLDTMNSTSRNKSVLEPQPNRYTTMNTYHMSVL